MQSIEYTLSHTPPPLLSTLALVSVFHERAAVP